MEMGPRQRECAVAEIDQAKADQIVGELYGRLSEGADFIEAVRPLSIAFSCHMVGLHFEDRTACESVMRVDGPASLRDISTLIADYNQNWRGKNEWLQRGMALMAKHGVSDGDDCISESELFKIPYFSHFLAPLDIRHGVGFLLQGSSDSDAAVLSLNRSKFEGHFSATERKLLPKLLPHLRSAFRIARTVETLKLQADDLSAALDKAGVGLALLNSESEIISINSAGHSALATLVHGTQARVGAQINLGSKKVNAWLRKSVVSATSEGQAKGPSPLIPLAIGLPRYALEVVPIRTGPTRHESRACVIFRRIDIDTAPSSDQKVLESIFAFTPSEASVVSQLVCLGTPDRVADRLGTSLSTVRSHIQHAFVKVGVRKQTDLVVIAERVLRGGFLRRD